MFKMDHGLSPWYLQNLITLVRNVAFCEPNEKGKSAHHEVIIKTSSWKLRSPYFIYLCCVIFMHDWQELQLAQSANCQLNGCNGRWHLLWCWWEMESKMTVMTGNWVSCAPVGKCGLNGWLPLHKMCLRCTRETAWSCYGHWLTRTRILNPPWALYHMLCVSVHTLVKPRWLPLSSLPFQHPLSHSCLCPVGV